MLKSPLRCRVLGHEHGPVVDAQIADQRDESLDVRRDQILPLIVAEQNPVLQNLDIKSVDNYDGVSQYSKTQACRK